MISNDLEIKSIFRYRKRKKTITRSVMQIRKRTEPVLRFKEFSNINEVEMYKEKACLFTRDQAVPLEKDEYFIADLIGLSVIKRG